jgi:hypothetical protein
MSKKVSPKNGKKAITVVLSESTYEDILILKAHRQPSAKLAPFVAWLIESALKINNSTKRNSYV